jgi:hypothetical protein
MFYLIFGACVAKIYEFSRLAMNRGFFPIFNLASVNCAPKFLVDQRFPGNGSVCAIFRKKKTATPESQRKLRLR